MSHGNEQYELGKSIADLTGQIKNVQDRVSEMNKALERLDVETVKTVEKHETSIQVLEVKMSQLYRFGWLVISALTGEFVAGLWFIARKVWIQR